MDAIEKRARKLLAAEYDRDSRHGMAGAVRRGKQMLGLDDVAIRAIIAALTPPEGFVLVPVQPTEAMVAAAEEAYMPFGDMGFAISAALASAALAARPEVKL